MLITGHRMTETDRCMNLLLRFFRRATRRPPRDTSSNAKDSSSTDASPGTGINQQLQPGDSSNPLHLITRGCTPSLDDSVPHPKQYLETTILGSIGSPDYKLREIVERPEGVDDKEWLAYHSKN